MALNKEKHVMLSYNYKSKNIVLQIKGQLENNGISVWFHERDMTDNIYDVMSQAVENAFVVCCFLTSDYESSRNCKFELEHVQRRGIRIIPCTIVDEKLWKPSIDGWLAFIIDSVIPVNMTNTNISELIDRINQNSLNGSVSIPKQMDFFRSIKYEHLRNNRIQRFMNEEKSLSMEETYINLSILDTAEHQGKHHKSLQINHHDFVIDSFEHIYGTKMNINVKDVFEKCKEKTKKVLLLGRCGIGKSTFCQYVAYRWAKGEIWTQYQLVIFIRLRFLTNNRYPPGHNYSPIDLVEKEYFPYDRIPDDEKEFFQKQCDRDEVLWILDGYDEFIENIPEQLCDVFNYLCNKQNHILISRPYSISFPYDVTMKIAALKTENISNYIHHFFDQIKDKQENISLEEEKLFKFLKSNSIIWSLVHIPINLEIMCNLWFDFDKSTEKNRNITELYESLIECLCRRYLTKQNINNMNMDKTTVYTHCQKQLTFLENLAFHGMENNSIIVQYNNETDDFRKDQRQIIDIGVLHLLNDKPIDCSLQSQDDYTFIHLGFQEYLAARYLINTLFSSSSEKAIDFIKNNKYNRRFLFVFTFASGLLNDNHYKSFRKIFWNTLLEEPLDLVGVLHIQLIIYCIDQTIVKQDLSQYDNLISSICQWIKCIVSLGYATIYEKLVYSLQRSISLVQEPTIISQFAELFQSSNSETKLNVYKIVSALSTCNPHIHPLNVLIIALDDENAYIRADACLTLGKIGEKAAKKEVISKLLNALTDRDDDVRRNACKTLGIIGVKVVTKEMLNKIILVLGDKNEDVREHACNTLGKLSEKAVTNEVIDKLVDVLGDENWNVRVNACKALHAIGGHKAFIKVINKLVEALENNNWKVKGNAAKVLGEMGESTATSEVISKLVNALGDENWNVRENACKALSNMAGYLIMTELISALVTALDDENSMIRENACIVLGSMGEKAATSEVISKLIHAFGDVNDNVRKNASEALAKIERKAPTIELIDKLLKASEHENWTIRKNSCVVIGYIGERIATTEMINKLADLFGDDNADVRWKACEALCKIGKKFSTTEVIDKLMNALVDTNDDIKQNACYALGELSKEAAIPEVISQLMHALEHTNENVRMNACQALGKMGDKVASNEIINKLSDLVEDEHWKTRASACESLGKIGEKAATNKAIDKLMKALEDRSWKVKQNACEALGKLGQKLATSEMIRKLVNVFEDEIEDVRESACQAICKMAEDSATNEVVNQLANAFVDENENIRCNACYALCRIGKKAAIPYVLSQLANALDNENANVRGNACKTFCEMGEYAATTEVITKLMNTLTDENDYVRCSACEALGAIGEKAITNEVIQKLANALEDEKKIVKLSACKALSQMGERAGTNEVVEELLIQIDNKDLSIRSAASKTLRKVCVSFDSMVHLHSNVVSKFLSYLERDVSSDWESVSSDMFINVYIDTKNPMWISIAILVALRRGSGITVTESSIVVYERKEPVQFYNIDQKLIEHLVIALKQQAMRLGVVDIRSPQVKVSIDQKEIIPSPMEIPERVQKITESSCLCIVL